MVMAALTLALKPQPVLPAWFPTAGPEQTAKRGPWLAVGKPAQQPEAQSALLMHWPVMNCWAFWLPTS